MRTFLPSRRTLLVLPLLLACGGSSDPPTEDQPSVEPTSGAEGTEATPSAEPESTVLITTLLAESPGTTLTLRVENSSTEPQIFCRYQTPFEGFLAPFLKVTASDGTEIAYQGVMVKRAPPGKDDYTTVAGGGAEQVSFDLAEAYPVTTGEYDVQFVGGEMSELPDSAPLHIQVP